MFAFTAAGDRTALIMNVNPVAPTGGDAFHPDAVYRVTIDTDGDNQADVAFSFVCSQPGAGRQTMTVYRADGAEARSHEAGGQKTVTDEPVSFTAEPEVITAGQYRLSAGLRSDAFFADLDGIVKDSGGAHPSLTAYFNQEDAKDAYNAAEPARDWDTSLQPWTAVLAHTGGYDAQAAETGLRTVLPDILRYDRSEPAAYPNGRTLTDDVTSARLKMISGGKVTSDHIGPHTDLLPDLPCLGTPHPATAAGPEQS
nr:DUF4331 family protein [Streptomyces sp. MZ04]